LSHRENDRRNRLEGSGLGLGRWKAAAIWQSEPELSRPCGCHVRLATPSGHSYRFFFADTVARERKKDRLRIPGIVVFFASREDFLGFVFTFGELKTFPDRAVTAALVGFKSDWLLRGERVGNSFTAGDKAPGVPPSFGPIV